MTILFIIFLATFYKTLTYFDKLHPHSKSSSFRNRKELEKPKSFFEFTFLTFFNRLFSRSGKPKTKTQLTNNDNASDTLSPNINKQDMNNNEINMLTPQSLPPDENFDTAKTINDAESRTNGPHVFERKRDYIAKHLSQLNFLDRMRYVGEKLESFIQLKFTRLGHFCATYPKLVLVIGFMFCFLMCLGYFNFKV
jgi:hypothetical protein